MCSLGKSMESFLEQLLRISYRAWNLESSGFQIFKWATDLAIVSAMLIVWVWGIHSCADRYTVVRWVREWGLVGQIWPCRGGFIFGRFFSKYERATNHFETHSSDLVWSLKPRISRIQICVKSDAEIVAVKFHWSFFLVMSTDCTVCWINTELDKSAGIFGADETSMVGVRSRAKLLLNTVNLAGHICDRILQVHWCLFNVIIGMNLFFSIITHYILFRSKFFKSHIERET